MTIVLTKMWTCALVRIATFFYAFFMGLFSIIFPVWFREHVGSTTILLGDFSPRVFFYGQATSYAVQKCCPFLPKRNTWPKNHFLRCPKRSLLDHQKKDNSLGQPYPVLFYQTFGQGRAVQKCCPFLFQSKNTATTDVGTPGTSITHVDVAAISAAARRQQAWHLLDSTHQQQPELAFDDRAKCGCPVASSNRVDRGVGGPR